MHSDLCNEYNDQMKDRRIEEAGTFSNFTEALAAEESLRQDLRAGKEPEAKA